MSSAVQTGTSTTSRPRLAFTVRTRRIRMLLAAIAILLPHRLRRAVHVRLLGHDIHPTAVLGRSFVDVDRLVMGPRAVIGPLNVIRGLELLRLDQAASISSLNLVNAVRRDKDFFAGFDRHPELLLGVNATIQMMHFVDCCDRVELQDRANLGGCWSLVLTHSFDVRTNRQATAPITLGTRTVVSARCTLLPGAEVPDLSIVAAMSLVRGPLPTPCTLYAGTPAAPVKALDPTIDFFTTEVEVRR